MHSSRILAEGLEQPQVDTSRLETVVLILVWEKREWLTPHVSGFSYRTGGGSATTVEMTQIQLVVLFIYMEYESGLFVWLLTCQSDRNLLTCFEKGTKSPRGTRWRLMELLWEVEEELGEGSGAVWDDIHQCDWHVLCGIYIQNSSKHMLKGKYKWAPSPAWPRESCCHLSELSITARAPSYCSRISGGGEQRGRLRPKQFPVTWLFIIIICSGYNSTFPEITTKYSSDSYCL